MEKYLVVFDLNETLLFQLQKDDIRVEEYKSIGILHDFSYKRRVVYNRPNLNILLDFIVSHGISYAFWSTSQETNLKHLISHLESIGFNNHKDVLSYDDCTAGEIKDNIKTDKWMKDLSVLSKKHGFDIENCILVDDNGCKSIPSQNLICCSRFAPGDDDDGINEICRSLDAFLNCNSLCLAKKKEGYVDELNTLRPINNLF